MNQKSRLEQLWATHHRNDHSKEIVAAYPFFKVYGSDDRIPAVTCKPKNRETWKLGTLIVHALYTPGHTTGCISYYVVDQERNETW